MPFISIIIPIYNAEKYLNSCIESVLSQQVKDFELLLINDGSKDNSLDICNEYASKDSRIKVFDKPNGGVSSARNLGLDNATGEYIMFIDADDRLTPNALEMFLPYIPEYDLVRMNVITLNPNGRSQKLHLVTTKDKKEAMDLSITNSIIVGPISALFRRSLFEEHNIRFDTALQIGEDWIVSTQLLYHAKSFIFLPDKVAYIYDRTNEASCTNTLSFTKSIQHYYALQKLEELVAEEKPQYDKAFHHTKAYIARVLWLMTDRKKVIEWFKVQPSVKELLSFKDIFLSKYSLGTKHRLFRCLCKIHMARLRK
jgi:glycosyltransferase involved in cell wall biosynthesis